MCGIAGIAAYHPQAQPVDATELVAIRDRMVARGPDADGLWIAPDARIGFGHRRLAILDLSEAGRQPMFSPDGQVVICFNGEIFNYPELRQELLAAGVQLKSTCDTEAIIHLYQREGTAAFKRLRGMYGIALWDARKRTMYLVRDPLGIKPVYYADDGRTLRFASQVKALQASPAVSRTRDLAAAAGYFVRGSIPEPRTWLADVKALPPGHWIEVSEGARSQPVPFETIEDTYRQAPLPGQGTLENLAATIAGSVAAHQMADVEVGLFLSSGLDSMLLLALAARANQPIQNTLTLVPDVYRGTDNDEGQYAEKMAQRYGAKHHNLVLTAGEVPGLLDRFFADVDQPSVDGLNTWLISRAAVSLGLKVALSGLGGDEMLAGYPSFKQAPFVAGIGRWLPGQKLARERLLPALGPAIGRHLSTPKWPALLGYTDSLAQSYLLMKSLFLPYELPALMGEEAAREGLRLWDLDRQLAAENARIAALKPVAAVSYLESTHYMRNQLLRDSDWAGMGHSLEIRTPLVDRDVLRAAAGALQSGAVTNKRAVVRQMLPELEAQILNKPKTGFTLPKNHWLQTQPGLDAWRKVPLLTAGNTYGGRRWAYVVAQRLELV